MYQLKSIFTAAAALTLFAVSSASFAGRYGDAEIRHSQQVKGAGG